MSSLPIVLVPHPHVRVDKKVLGGSPHVTGTRVPVRRLYGFYRNGASIEKILKRYPQLNPAKVFDALAFALDNPEVIQADMAREEEMLEGAAERKPRPHAATRQVEFDFQTSTGDDSYPGDEEVDPPRH